MTSSLSNLLSKSKELRERALVVAHHVNYDEMTEYLEHVNHCLATQETFEQIVQTAMEALTCRDPIVGFQMYEECGVCTDCEAIKKIHSIAEKAGE